MHYYYYSHHVRSVITDALHTHRQVVYYMSLRLKMFLFNELIAITAFHFRGSDLRTKPM